MTPNTTQIAEPFATILQSWVEVVTEEQKKMEEEKE